MMLGKVKGAVEREDHFEIDDGSGRAFKVAKAALSPRLVDRVRELYCGGKVQHFVEGGEALMPPGPRQRPGGFWDTLLGGEQTAAAPAPAVVPPAPVEVIPEGETRLPISPMPGGTSVAPAPLLPGAGPALAPQEVSSIGGQLSDFFSSVAKAQVAPKPVVAPTPAAPPPEPPAPVAPGELGRVPVAEPAAPAAAPTGVPSAADAVAEAKAAGAEAARKIADAGDLAKRSLDERAAAEAQARAAEMSAAEGLVRAQDEATQRAEQEADRMRQVYARGETALRLQKEKLATREKQLLDPEAMRIETGRVFSRADPVGLMIGAMMVGAAEAGLGRGSGSEAALKVIGDAIDRDVMAQKVEKGGLQSARFQAYQAAVGDVQSAGQLLKADQQLAAAAAARLEAQRTQSAQGRVMLAQVANSLSAQARKTAEDAVQLITGQALAQQKAASEAEGRSMALRQGEAALVRSAAEIEESKRRDARADAQLEMARQSLGISQAELGLKQRQQALTEAMAAGVPVARQASQKGILGGELTPQEIGAVPEKERDLYVTVPSKTTGEVVYRRARSEKDAERATKVFGALDEAISSAMQLDTLINKPGYSAPTILPGTKAKTKSEQLQQKIILAMKDVRELGALTASDMKLVEPFVPDPQSWTSTDAQEAAQLQMLLSGFQQLRAIAEEKLLMARPGQRPVLSQGAQ